MTKYFARVVDGAVVEMAQADSAKDLSGLYHPDIVKDMLPSTSDVCAGWTFDGKRFQPPAAYDGVSLSALQSILKSSIDASAEVQRLKYLTPGEGQALTYQRKVDEAKRASSDIAPSNDDYPLLAASLGIDGETLLDVAKVVLEMDRAWALIGAAIEKTRLSAKRDIDQALSEEAARNVVVGLEWPSKETSA
ncbi:hypothetical protein G6L41_008625 [Agrobacterium tumefaciens]|uniref:hypothetical protein n=1 Tax=Agrobacterium tumefaciens TaxID=358 RepID=UPI0015719F26|nr:hypothetical protein [Agrobacterium tumefaciens]WCK12333.1 hypothetical protein G6L41_008625 [Agrobacterium tumefaciens]